MKGAERDRQRQAYDRVHGAGAFDKKSQKENEELHLTSIALVM